MRCAVRKCRAQLRERTDRLGRILWTCDGCERRKAGICQRCPNRVTGRLGYAKWCATCKPIVHREQVRAFTKRRKEYDPQAHAARLEHLRLLAWRKRGALTPEERLARLQAAGRKAGHIRAANLSPARRSEIAKLGGTTRWARAAQ